MITLSDIRNSFATYKASVIHGADAVCAGVIVPVFEKDGDVHIVLTRRTDTVSIHKGEVSFPGGMCEEKDGNTMNTALRECCEEIGVKPADVEVVGRLDDMYTLTGYIITPYVGIMPYPYPFRTNPQEVAYIICLPFRFLYETDPLLEEAEYKGKVSRVPSFYFHGDRIWGATCRMLLSFRGIIGNGSI